MQCSAVMRFNSSRQNPFRRRVIQTAVQTFDHFCPNGPAHGPDKRQQMSLSGCQEKLSELSYIWFIGLTLFNPALFGIYRYLRYRISLITSAHGHLIYIFQQEFHFYAVRGQTIWWKQFVDLILCTWIYLLQFLWLTYRDSEYLALLNWQSMFFRPSIATFTFSKRFSSV